MMRPSPIVQARRDRVNTCGISTPARRCRIRPDCQPVACSVAGRIQPGTRCARKEHTEEAANKPVQGTASYQHPLELSQQFGFLRGDFFSVPLVTPFLIALPADWPDVVWRVGAARLAVQRPVMVKSVGNIPTHPAFSAVRFPALGNVVGVQDANGTDALGVKIGPLRPLGVWSAISVCLLPRRNRCPLFWGPCRSPIAVSRSVTSLAARSPPASVPRPVCPQTTKRKIFQRLRFPARMTVFCFHGHIEPCCGSCVKGLFAAP